MKTKLLSVLLAALAVTWAVFAFSPRASAQTDIPTLQALIFQGDVTVEGQPELSGWTITARIGDSYESRSAVRTGSRYTLQVGPAPELIGQPIQFWIEGQFKASEVGQVFVARSASGAQCPSCAWIVPPILSVDLAFDSAPVPTPTPTFTPTATVVVVAPSVYSGVVTGDDGLSPPDGTELFARINDYETKHTVIHNGQYRLVVNPMDERYQGERVRFFVTGGYLTGEIEALWSIRFLPGVDQPGVDPQNLTLPFPSFPPTPTPTPTPDPTAIAAVTATAEAAEGGGGCRSSAGGPAGIGPALLVLAPLALAAWRRRGLR